jgi:L-seryl-tRNA(Ser) seleniumtransferase
LFAHRSGRAEELIPLYRMFAADPDSLRLRAEALAQVAARHGLRASAAPTEDPFGGGAAPGKALPGWALSIDPPPEASQLAERARAFDPPIIGTVRDNRFQISVRTLLPGDETEIMRFFQTL